MAPKTSLPPARHAGRKRPIFVATTAFYDELPPDFGDDLYRQPSLLVLSADEVYRHFVLPEVGVLRDQADQERARAERLAAKLCALGINVDGG
jgi:hypothetical protein